MSSAPSLERATLSNCPPYHLAIAPVHVCGDMRGETSGRFLSTTGRDWRNNILSWRKMWIYLQFPTGFYDFALVWGP